MYNHDYSYRKQKKSREPVFTSGKYSDFNVLPRCIKPASLFLEEIVDQIAALRKPSGIIIKECF